MSEPIEAFFALAGACFVAVLIGGSFTLGGGFRLPLAEMGPDQYDDQY